MAGASGPGTPKEDAGQSPAVPATPEATPRAASKADQAGLADDPTILIITGVSGSGKTTIAAALAQQLDWPFKEGDELHPASDITKMLSGHPLDDRDRWPWLEKVADWIDSWRQAGTSGVITCSALRRSYRDFLTRGRPAGDCRAPGRPQRAFYAGEPPRQPVRNPGGARPRRRPGLHRRQSAG
jgi:hypothetical protein